MVNKYNSAYKTIGEVAKILKLKSNKKGKLGCKSKISGVVI